MAGVTAASRALTESERAILRSFGIDGRLPAGLPEPLETAIVAWFQALVGQETAAGAGLAEARVAWLLADAPCRWGDRFLAADVPPELVSALRKAWPCLTPREAPMAMPPQPLHGDSALVGAMRRLGRISLRRDRAVPAR